MSENNTLSGRVNRPGAESHLGIHLEAVARKVLGNPNPHLSTKTQLRFGTNGSLSVEIAGDKAGTWYDHEEKIGGGTLDFIRVKEGLVNGAAFDFLRSIGIDVAQPHESTTQEKWKFITDYHYQYADGSVPYRVVRWLKPDGRKSFSQEKADGKGRWIKGKRVMDGVTLVPYRLPELLGAIADGKTILIPEGEKDVENLQKLDFAATCNPGGAGKWPDDFSAHFRGADVVILVDNDKAGRDHAEKVSASLIQVASRVRILHMPDGTPEKGDISWWIERGTTAHQITAMLDTAQLVEPAIEANQPAEPVVNEGHWLNRCLLTSKGAVRPCFSNIMLGLRKDPAMAYW